MKEKIPKNTDSQNHSKERFFKGEAMSSNKLSVSLRNAVELKSKVSSVMNMIKFTAKIKI